jgi:hypothetical protein
VFSSLYNHEILSGGTSQRREEHKSVEVVKDVLSMKTKPRRKEAIYTGTRSQATGTRATYLRISEDFDDLL